MKRKRGLILTVFSGIFAVASIYGVAAYGHFVDSAEWYSAPTMLLLITVCVLSVGGVIGGIGVYATVPD